jgi:hypothetical protein
VGFAEERAARKPMKTVAAACIKTVSKLVEKP